MPRECAAFFLFPQPRQLLLNDSNLGFGVGFLFAFLFHHGGRSAIHEVFVGEFYGLFQKLCLFLQQIRKQWIL